MGETDSGLAAAKTLCRLRTIQWKQESLPCLRGRTAAYTVRLQTVRAAPVSAHRHSVCGVPQKSAAMGFGHRRPGIPLSGRPDAVPLQIQPEPGCGQILGDELVAAVVRSDRPLPQASIPVPLHRSRQFSRSFNQAETLARQAGKALKIPVHSGLLSRKRRTGAHSGLDAAARRKNIRGAFYCRPNVIRHVALVDDVLTTGATLAECTRTLKRAGVEQVSVWIAARALINQ